MSPSTTTLRLLASGLLVLCSLAQADDAIDETRPVKAGAMIEVENIAGVVEVSGWDRNELHLTGSLGDTAERLDISETSNGWRIEVRYPRKTRRVDSTDLYLKVPHGVSLDVDTVSADIRVDDIEGQRLMLNSVSGDITARASGEQAELATVSGDLLFRGNAVRTRVNTVSGDMEVDGVSGELDLKTVSGDVDLRAGSLTEGRFESVSGNLDLVMDLAPAARIDVESLSGDVGLGLPDGLSGRLRADTFSGRIRTAFGSESVSRDGKELDVSVGEGRAQLRVETFSGDVRFNRR